MVNQPTPVPRGRLGALVRPRGILLGVALALLVACLPAWFIDAPARPVIAKPLVHTVHPADRWEAMVRSQPLAFLQRALEHYHHSVRDYTAVFEKQELVGGELGQLQVIDVKFREMPFSVAMNWLQNPFRAERVLYVEGQRRAADGKEMVLVRPAGVIAVLVPRVTRDIHGRDSAKVSRRTIDEFGFANTLRLILEYSRLAQQRGELTLLYKGTSEIDGRATYLFERHLPYDREIEQPYPDRVLLFHIDKEWLLPTACYSFGDADQKVLLGGYVFKNVQLNPGLADADFTPEANGL